MDILARNKAVARRFLELVAAHDVDGVCALIAPTWRLHGGPPGLSQGPDGVRELFRSFGAVEQAWTVEDVVAEADRVVVRAASRCTQETFLGVPAAGRQQTFTATFMHRIAHGWILETWRNADDLGRLLQLGARIQAPAAGA